MARKPKVQLTDSQFAFLCQLLVLRPQTAVDYYRPATALFDVGFATRVQGPYTWTYTVTDAGRAHHQKVYMADKVCGRGCKKASWTCRVCGRKTCEHFCTNKWTDKTAVCGRCYLKR